MHGAPSALLKLAVGALVLVALLACDDTSDDPALTPTVPAGFYSALPTIEPPIVGDQPGFEFELVPTPDPGSADALAPTPATGAADQFTVPERVELKHPKLGSSLDDLVARIEAGDVSPEDAAQEASLHQGGSVAVTIHLSGNVDEVVRYLEANGASTISVGEDYIEALVPVLLLGQTSEQPGVLRVRLIQPPESSQSPSGVAGNGPEAHGSLAWNQAGYTGQGIKVGIIDGGFKGFSDLMGTELPQTVVARCYQLVGQPSENLADCENTAVDHGTAVAESITDIAPDVTLYIAQVSTPGTVKEATKWMVDEGVKVINFSAGLPFDGPGDGTSPSGDSPLKAVDLAVDSGVLWVNAAGNYAQKTWFQRGPYSDPDDDGAINFTTTDEGNAVFLAAGHKKVELRWDDSWGGANRDFDLALYNASGTLLLTTADPQSGGDGHIPHEHMVFKVVISGVYSIAVIHRSGSVPAWIQLAVKGDGVGPIQHHTGIGSIVNPAESANPGMLAVGASHWEDVNSIESYSGRGPTPDRRIKPDVVGADCGETVSDEAFCGTSQAAPHVAGLAALVRQRFPGYSPEQVVAYLKENAEQRVSSPDPNSTWGHGFIKLSTPSQTIGSPSIQSITPGANSLTVQWSAPSNDGGSAVTAYDLRHIQSNASSQADANWTVVQDAWTGTGPLQYVVTGLTNGVQYDVQVRAVNNAGDGPWSAVAAGTTMALVTTPGAPGNLTATANGQTRIDLSWSAPSDDGGAAIDGYRIEVSTNGSTWSDLEANTRSTSTSYSHTGLTAGITRHYRVSASNSVGTGTASNVANATTGAAPDLVVDTPTVDASAPAAGARFTLSATVRNQGNGSSASTTLRYYRSTDSTITTGDTEVGTDSVFRLDGSESGAESISLTAPSTPGTYFYGACVDSVSDESNTTNNCSSAVTVTVGAAPAPDLVVDTPTVDASAPAAGARFTLSATVRNQGNGSSAFTTLRYYQSTDPTITTSDTEVGTDSVSGLNPSGSSDESISLTAPSTPGTYYYGACVGSVSDESDTTNNCSPTVTVTVGAAPAPDLVVETPTVDASAPAAGARFTLSTTVRNQGNGSSAFTTLRYYRSTDSTITTGDTEVGTDLVSGLNSSGISGESISLTAPSAPGTYYYGACVDSVSDESDTTNNCSPAVTVTVGAAPAPDLVVDTPTVDASAPAAGARFTLSATVRNQGNGSSAFTTLRYYQSTDSTITTGDTEVGTDAVFRLDGSESGAELISLTAPSSPGTYYYGACVDSVSDESDTTNNCSPAVTVAVGAAPAPDLVVDTPTVDASAPAAGARFTLSATVRNQGNGSSAFTTLRYYRSSDPTITTGDTEVGTDSVSGLNPSGISGESISLTAPSTPGTYYYGACVDSVSDESDTTNNCSPTVTVTVGAAPAPDLVVDTPTVDASAPAAGARFTLSVTVRNQGNGSSAFTTLRYYRSTDPTITTDDTEVGTDAVFRLDGSESGAESISLTAPSTPGTYYYGACVDSVSDESDTTNNCSATVTVMVGAAPAPDVVLSTPRVSASTPTAGASFVLSVTTENQGSASSQPTTLRFYRSTDSTISSSDTQLGTYSVPILGPGGGFIASDNPTAPSSPGTYYYGACVDSVSDESDTTNNCSAAVTVIVGASASVPGAPTALTANADGQTEIDLSWTAPSNDGGASITGYRIEVSTNGTTWSDLVGDTRSTTTSNTHSGLTAGSTRYYQVSAINSAGTGPASNVANATTDSSTTPPGETSACATGSAVPDGANSPGLVSDCDNLLAVKDTLRGTGNLNWSANVPIVNWDGITVGGTPKRVTRLELRVRGTTRVTGTIPADLGNLTNLEVLSIYGASTSDNQPIGLTGTIPAKLGNLINLQELTLHQHQLSGTIPVELGDLINLETLNLNFTQLSGAIPTELGGLTALKTLNLYDNDLTGTVPPGLGNLANLETLNFSLNRMSGTIPTRFGNLANLKVLSLGFNSLSGTIPTQLGNLSNLETLAMGFSRLSGAIPTQLGNLTNLKSLSLGGNQLTGTIPSELGGLTKVTVLLLHKNRLTGTIPPELSGLTMLRQLQLSSNQLTGCIPAALREVESNDLAQLGLPYCGSANAPGAPTGLTATANGQTQIDLSWTAPSDNGGEDITGYRIEVSTDGSNWSDLEANTDSTSTTYSHTGLTAGNTRHYRVSAINSVGTGAASNVDNATTDSPPAATAPGAPTGLTATANGQTQIDLSWIAPSDNGGANITGYKIEVSTNGSSWSDLVANNGSGSITYSHTGLMAGNTRHYRVSAINSAGTGAASDVADATTAEEQATDRTCTVDLIVRPGESCTYPGTSTEFTVDSSGTGQFLFTSSGSRIELRNTTINGVTYTFVASKQSDGNWRVEEVG